MARLACNLSTAAGLQWQAMLSTRLTIPQPHSSSHLSGGGAGAERQPHVQRQQHFQRQAQARGAGAPPECGTGLHAQLEVMFRASIAGHVSSKPHVHDSFSLKRLPVRKCKVGQGKWGGLGPGRGPGTAERAGKSRVGSAQGPPWGARGEMQSCQASSTRCTSSPLPIGSASAAAPSIWPQPARLAALAGRGGAASALLATVAELLWEGVERRQLCGRLKSCRVAVASGGAAGLGWDRPMQHSRARAATGSPAAH